MLRALLKTMRPKQWSKNIFIFAALVFDQKLFRPMLLGKTIGAFALFCLISSAVYLINDLADIEKDRQHPVKRNRPLASGMLPPRVAVIAAALIVVLCVPLAYLIAPAFGVILLGYLLLMIAYSFHLKHVVIVDVLTVATGFVLRVAAGTVVIRAERFSPWLYICMTLLAIFLAVGKRRHELLLLEGNANEHRAILDEYNIHLLDDIIVIVIAAVLVAYSFYTFSAPNLPPNHSMMLTIPFVLYGLFRYLYLIHVRNEGGAPEDIIVSDLPLIIDFGLWGGAVVLVMYVL